MSRTLLQLCQAVADNLVLYENGSNTAAANTTTATAAYPFKTSLSTADSNEYVGDEFRPSSGAEAGNARDIITYAPSTGVLTMSHAWNTGMAAADTFDIYRKKVRFAHVKEAVNKALRFGFYQTVAPLTLVADGDMETSGTASWGTASNATFTKVATAGNLLRGAQGGRVVNSSAFGYLPSATLTCVPGDQYYLEAKVRASIGTAHLQATDVTNSATITSETWANQGWGKIAFTFTIPATCESMRVQLAGAGASDDCYWDDVILQRAGAKEFTLPSWVTRRGQVKRVLTSSNDTRYDEDAYVEHSHWQMQPDEGNVLNQWKLVFSYGVQGSVWILAVRPYSELSADSDACYADREWIETAATVNLLERLVNRYPGAEAVAWKVELGRQQKKLAGIQRKLSPAMNFRFGFDTAPNTPEGVWF